MQRPEDGSDVTEFGSFDDSTCERVLDLLEPGDLRLGQVVIKRVAVAPSFTGTENNTQLNNDNGMINYFLWLTYCRSVQNLSHWQRSVLQSLGAHMSS